FHLYPLEKINSNDPLHWTGFYQNWNYMCAECHSTNVQKNYDEKLNQFHTSWSEINVSCEACHGQGSRHVSSGGHKGFDISLQPVRTTWAINSATGSPEHLTKPPVGDTVVQLCARCHSRGTEISDHYVWGRPLMNTHIPALLDESLYYDDGQIREEVYE